MQFEKKAIELFSGSAQISKILRTVGFSSINCDSNPKFKADYCCDISNFPLSESLRPVSLIWASPCCTTFSRHALHSLWVKETFKYRQYNYYPNHQKTVDSLKMIDSTIAIIDFYKPPVWFMENPVGRLRHIPAVKKFAPYRYSVNYKDWGFHYSKETDIYTNQLLSLPTKKQIRYGIGVNSLNSSFNRSLIPSSLILWLIYHSVFNGLTFTNFIKS